VTYGLVIADPQVSACVALAAFCPDSVRTHATLNL
jgi:hypothetical protein